jgi:hypothetical protein
MTHGTIRTKCKKRQSSWKHIALFLSNFSNKECESIQTVVIEITLKDVEKVLESYLPAPHKHLLPKKFEALRWRRNRPCNKRYNK